MLQISDVKKIYGNGRGLKSMSLDISEGETVSFVGPNGSGKSTSLNIIAGVMAPDRGICSINGYDTYAIGTKSQIGYLEEDAYYYPNATVTEYLNFIWSVKYPRRPNDEMLRLLDTFDLMDFSGNKLKSLSMGMRKRVGIVSAIMNYPPLIVLDEPTNSIDTKSLLTLKDELALAAKMGCHIILSGHVLDFIKSVASRIVFLNEGEVTRDIANEDGIDLDELYRDEYAVGTRAECG
jgi:ABC-2 type transport system ATP-binding protein